MPAYIDARPPGIHLHFRPDTTLTVVLNWQLPGVLAGRTFTSTLDGVAMDVTVVGDVMTLEASAAETAVIVNKAEWELLEDLGGVSPEPIMVGDWVPSEQAAARPATLTIVVDEAVAIDVSVFTGGLTTAALNAHVADDEAHGDPMAGLRTLTPVIRDTYLPMLRGAPDPARWTRYLIGVDVDAPDSALSFEHGKAVIRVVGGDGLTSERHEFWTFPDVPASRYGRIRSRWASRPAADGIIQHVHVHNFQQAAGKNRGVVLWDGIFGSPSGGVWESNTDGTSFVSAGANVVDSEAVTVSGRDGAGLVTATVPAGATDRWRVGDAVRVDLQDATYDGSFVLSSVTSTQVQWTQTNGTLDASGGTGSMHLLGNHFTNFSTMTNVVISFTDAVRTNGVVVSTGVAAGHPLQIGDRIVVDAADNTYDGRFVVSDVNQTTNQVTWLQPGVANDAAATTGTLTKNNPLWCESQLLPGNILQARFWPDKGVDLNGGTPGPTLGGAPSWEQHGWTLTFDIDTVTGVTIPSGPGAFGVGAAHHSSNSPVQYDNLEVVPLYVGDGV